jgi:hypothetical protein
MGQLNATYGSELHLLRYMGRHREAFNCKVESRVGLQNIRWLDFSFTNGKKSFDSEPKGIVWLKPSADLAQAWAEFWPSSGEQMNWDAIGRAGAQGSEVWLLVEAKAHTGEIKSNCTAKPAYQRGGRDKIQETLEGVKQELGITHTRSWLVHYYQHCNRLATLHFLRSHAVAAELLYVYFTGDTPGKTRKCPRNPREWTPTLKEMHEYVGLPSGCYLSNHVHELFLHVAGKE